MIELLAKQAVQIKCKFDGAGLTGEYEFAYASGLMCKITATELLQGFKTMTQLQEYVIPKVEAYTTKDEKVSRLIAKMHDFVVEHEEVNEQIIDLYKMGYQDERL